MNKKLTPGVFLMVLFGCSTMSKEECITANWKLIGENDARAGKTKLHFSNYQKKCQESGVSINNKKYFSGYAEGLKTYCTYENGYEVGASGENYSKICPSESSKEFVKGFIAGKYLFEQKQYYEKKQKIQEEEMQRNSVFREKVLGNMTNKTCNWDPDCRIEDKCEKDKCLNTGNKCTFDSDCRIEGVCNVQKCQF